MNAEQMAREKDRYTDKARQVVNQMSLEEKVALMSGDYGLVQAGIDMLVFSHYNRVPALAGGNRRLGVPALKFRDGPTRFQQSSSALRSHPSGRSSPRSM